MKSEIKDINFHPRVPVRQANKIFLKIEVLSNGSADS